jgi:DNA invertase Pin-like site-specific DNA recombinase
MPKRKRPHPHEVLYLPIDDPALPLSRRLALYTRLSDDDADSVSHAHQEQVAREWAERCGYSIVAIYRDWRTGFDPNRRALTQFIEDAHAAKHGGVVVYDHYRFHRGVTGAYPVVMLHNQLPGYAFYAASGSYDVDHIGIWAGISGLEAATTRRRSTEQRRYRASLGQLVSGKWPYWLERDPVTRRPVIVQDRAQALLEAISQYSNGTRIRVVVAWLNEHAPPGGKARCWSSERFRKAMRNPALWGRLDYARSLPVTERRNGEFVTVGYTPNPDAVRLEVPPLVHRTELEQTECRIAGGCERDSYPAADTLDKLIISNGGRACGRPYALPHPLRRRVVCACGWRMAYAPNHYRGRESQYGMLICGRMRARGNGLVKEYPTCATNRISAGPVWEHVRAQFIAAINDPDRVIRAVEAAILAESNSNALDLADEAIAMALLAEKLSDIDGAENRLYERWDSKKITSAIYEGQLARLEAERRDAEQKKRKILDRQRILQRVALGTSVLREALVATQALPLSEFTPAEWTTLFDALVADVVLDSHGQATLRWREMSESEALRAV